MICLEIGLIVYQVVLTWIIQKHFIEKKIKTNMNVNWPFFKDNSKDN